MDLSKTGSPRGIWISKDWLVTYLPKYMLHQTYAKINAEIYVLSSYIPLYGNILLLIYNTDLILIGVWLLGMGNFLLKICTDLENIMLSEISSPVFAPGECRFTSNWRVELEVSQVRFHYSATGVFLWMLRNF